MSRAALAPSRPARVPVLVQIRLEREAAEAAALAGPLRRARAFLLAATLLYLAVELPFAARLVDVLGSGADAAAVHALETAGRYVSGAALALAAWGVMLPRMLRARRRPADVAVRLALAAAACVALMVHGQRALVDAVADMSSPAFRQGATRAAAAREAMATGIAGRPAGMEPGPAWRAAVGVLPMLSALDPAALKRAGGDAATDAYARAAFPDAGTLKSSLDRAAASLRQGFPRYADGGKRYLAATSNLGADADKAWDDYLKRVPRRHLARADNPEVAQRIAREVRNAGISVPVGWHPLDRATFQASFVGDTRRQADSAYRSAVVSAMGEGPLPPAGLPTVDALAASPAMQDRLKRALGLPTDARPVRLSYDAASFRPVHAAARDEAARFLRGALAGPSSAFADGSAHAAAGRDAVRLAVAPFLALVLSAMGALGHLAKVANYAGSLALPRVRVAWRGAAVAGGLAVAVGLMAPPAWLSASPSWHPASVPGGAATMSLAGWAVGAHAAIHPLGSALAGNPAYALAARAEPGLSAR